jgi:CheY-like chemotaxis protein
VLDLNGVGAGIDRLLRRVIGEDVELVTVPDPNLGCVKADPGQIEQAIMNLAVNARDAMPNGGTLTIQTANVDLDEAYGREHVSVQPGPYVMIAVSDTGCGMDETTKARLFEPFFTTKEVGKGTGLGLATVYGIVKQHGGSIWVSSEPGQGATFKIYLPRVEEPADVLVQEERGAVRGGSETILVVEDEPVVRGLICHILEMHGYAVLQARQGDEAIEVCRRHEGSIPLLVTDVVMPGMSGKQLAVRLVESLPGLKILFLSGYTGNAIIHHGVLQEGAAFLQKPFTPDALARKVREILDP